MARLSVAPMMRHSHLHARTLWRMFDPHALLHTEMVPAAAVARDRGVAHRHDPRQDPVVLQVAGAAPAELAVAARRAADLGFHAINLNCGCPSARVVAGGFGACQMAEPAAVARLVAAMVAGGPLPVTVKCRLGVDDQDPAASLPAFARAVRDAGAVGLVVHARKAWLGGLNPRQNRSRPPLQPQHVTALRQELAGIKVFTNGEIHTVADATARAAGVDGVMVGRAIVARPQLLAEFAAAWHGHEAPPVAAVIDSYLGHVDDRLAAGERRRELFAPLAPLAHGRPGARRFRVAVMDAAEGRGGLDTVRAAWR